LLKPKTRDGWIAAGAKGIVERAKDEVRSILKDSYPTKLADEMNSALDLIIKA